MTKDITISKMVCGNISFCLQYPLLITVKFLDNVWSHTCDKYNFHGYGLTEQASLDMLHKDFAICWKEIACENDTKLTPKAKLLKQDMKQLVKHTNE